jgi:hypothetical protein
MSNVLGDDKRESGAGVGAIAAAHRGVHRGPSPDGQRVSLKAPGVAGSATNDMAAKPATTKGVSPDAKAKPATTKGFPNLSG